ncbi:MAG: mechanosensitive ion channel [Lachnospiraceae bacterium]|nr:mechanosensitive ion channel [Lachnospiraceae bacterium]
MDFFEVFLNKIVNTAMNLGGRIILALVILFAGTKVIKIVLKLIKKAFNRADIEVSVEQFLYSLIQVALYVVLAFLVASNCGVDAASIIALLGSAGVAIGLALQGSLSNVAGGVLILLMRPFRVGDYIVDAAGNEGVVDEIQIIYTKLRTGDNKIIVLPNGNLANNSITNVTTSKTRRCDIVIGISYEADIREAKKVIMEVLENDPETLKDKDMMVYVSLLADSSVNLGVRCWFDTQNYFTGLSRLNEEIKYALDNANINIPYPQIDVHMKKD